MKKIVLLSFLFLSFSMYCQKPDFISQPEIKLTFKSETNISIKVGTTVNFINKTIYKELNDGLSSELYKPDNTSFFINPYVTIGVESKIKKHFGLQFNLGFYQTLQKYTTLINYKIPMPGYNKKYYEFEQKTNYQYLNNNVFLELLPMFYYKHTRILAGINVTSGSPTLMTKTTVKNLTTDDEGTYSSKEKPETSYHVYSMLGIMQGFPIKKHQFIISLTYFGFLKKYDSGLNLTAGFMF